LNRRMSKKWTDQVMLNAAVLYVCLRFITFLSSKMHDRLWLHRGKPSSESYNF
jgi:hypothetical protein